MLLFLKKIYLNDYFNPYTITFENPETYEMLSLMVLYHYVMSFLIGVVVFTFFYILQTLKTIVIVSKDDPRVQRPGDRETLFTFRVFYTMEEYERIFKNYILGRGIQHAPVLEFIWVLIPSAILVLIAYPSLILLYNNESIIEPMFNVTVIGNQWYWTYEYNDFNLHTLLYKVVSQQTPDYELASLTPAQRAAFVEASNRTITLDSNMIITTSPSMPRLLTTDQPLVLPSNTPIRMIVTSADVIHSWAVPAFGVKVDAVPGRLNQIIINLPVLGTSWGQCSELCGINHGFMPIEIKVLPISEFLYFMQLKTLESLDDLLPAFTTPIPETILEGLSIEGSVSSPTSEGVEESQPTPPTIAAEEPPVVVAEEPIAPPQPEQTTDAPAKRPKSRRQQVLDNIFLLPGTPDKPLIVDFNLPKEFFNHLDTGHVFPKDVLSLNTSTRVVVDGVELDVEAILKACKIDAVFIKMLPKLSTFDQVCNHDATTHTFSHVKIEDCDQVVSRFIKCKNGKHYDFQFITADTDGVTPCFRSFSAEELAKLTIMLKSDAVTERAVAEFLSAMIVDYENQQNFSQDE